MTSIDSIFRSHFGCKRPLIGWLCSIVLLVGSASNGIAQDKATSTEPSQAVDSREPGKSTDTELTIGIAGHYRVGCWTALRLDDDALVRQLADADRIAIETLDGDGVAVRYEASEPSDDGFYYLVPGSEAAPIRIFADGDEVVSARFPVEGAAERGPAMLPLEMPWVVAIGDPLGIEKIGANELLKRSASVAVTRASSDQLPDHVMGYQGVDMILINQSGIPVLRELSPRQTKAISDWLQGGGQIVVGLGASAEELAATAPWLIELLPLESPLQVRTMDPSAIETYTSSQNPLDEFKGVMLPRDEGQILITGRTSRRVITPLAVDYGVAFGHVIVVAMDLDGPQLNSWTERMDLIRRMTGSMLLNKEDVVAGRATSFDDIAGQMRASLDQFDQKPSFPFSVIALILMVLIAAVGPLDFLLINRVLGKPILGWLTFPLMTVGLSAVLIWQANSVGGVDSESEDTNRSIQANRFEVLDIDTTRGVGRAFSWGYAYSHDAVRFDVSLEASGVLEEITPGNATLVASPFGYAGTTFGGIQISGRDNRFPDYAVDLGGMSESGVGSLEGVSLAPRSSKSLAVWSRFVPELEANVSMSRRAGSELLRGELRNPLPCDLLDGMLVYRNWVYLLPTRFPESGTINEVGDLRQKPFKWQMTKRTALEKSRTDNEDWLPTAFDNPARVAEILMFNAAAGSERYTGLKNDAMNFLDLSNMLLDDRCMLVGRVADPSIRLELRLDQPACSDHQACWLVESRIRRYDWSCEMIRKRKSLSPKVVSLSSG